MRRTWHTCRHKSVPRAPQFQSNLLGRIHLNLQHSTVQYRYCAQRDDEKKELEGQTDLADPASTKMQLGLTVIDKRAGFTVPGSMAFTLI